MNNKFLTSLLLFVSACIGCNPPPAPNKVLPNAGRLVQALGDAKGSGERLAQNAKQHFLPLRMKDGASLYETTKTAHNSAISRMIIALGEPAGSLPQADLQNLLTTADQSAREFQDWYVQTFGRERKENPKGMAEAMGPSEIIAVIGIINDWMILEQQNNRDQREAIRKELSACKWRDWNSL